MTGTMAPATFPMRLIPPMITSPTRIATPMPKKSALPSKKGSTRAVCANAWFDWNMLPPPKLPPMQSTAKRIDSALPSLSRPRLRSPAER